MDSIDRLRQEIDVLKKKQSDIVSEIYKKKKELKKLQRLKRAQNGES